MKRCFVISPIGPEGSEIREHANDVYDFIIEPAMVECGIQAIRSDQLQEPGRISEQMFREIIGDDLCVAVLTGHNPNVFYELAIAQAAAKPVIILVHKGQTLPFDTKDLRSLEYDLKPRTLSEQVHTKPVVAHVKSLENDGLQSRMAFGNYTPLGPIEANRWPPGMLPDDQLVLLERTAREASEDHIRFACLHTLWSIRPDRAKVIIEHAEGDWRDYVKRHAKLLLERFYRRDNPSLQRPT